MEPLYKETYRGVGFHKTHKGYWIFDENPFRSWNRYFTRSDEEGPPPNELPDDEVVAMIRRAIDRKLEEK